MSDASVVADPVITLAPMRRRHLRGVVDHERAVYAKPWTIGLFLSELARPETRSYIIARAGAVLVGHAGVLFIADEGHLTTVVVAPDWQRHHVATRMLLYQFDHAIARGIDALTLEVRVHNTGARELYRRFGFVPAGIRKGYYAETGEDALIMWAHDISSPRACERRAEIAAALPGPTRLDNLDDGRGHRMGADGHPSDAVDPDPSGDSGHSAGDPR